MITTEYALEAGTTAGRLPFRSLREVLRFDVEVAKRGQALFDAWTEGRRRSVEKAVVYLVEHGREPTAAAVAVAVSHITRYTTGPMTEATAAAHLREIDRLRQLRAEAEALEISSAPAGRTESKGAHGGTTSSCCISALAAGEELTQPAGSFLPCDALGAMAESCAPSAGSKTG